MTFLLDVRVKQVMAALPVSTLLFSTVDRVKKILLDTLQISKLFYFCFESRECPTIG